MSEGNTDQKLMQSRKGHAVSILPTNTRGTPGQHLNRDPRYKQEPVPRLSVSKIRLQPAPHLNPQFPCPNDKIRVCCRTERISHDKE